MSEFWIGLASGVMGVLVYAFVDRYFYRKRMRKRFDAEVDAVLRKDLTYRS